MFNPMRPWFYFLFKSDKDGLSRYKAHWNFIQSGTRMSIEKTFGMLKGRFRILLKRVDTPLCRMLDLLMAFIWTMFWKFKEAKGNSTFSNIKRANLFKVIEEAIKQMKRLQNPRIMDDDRIDMEDIEHQGEDENVTTIENNPNKKAKEERMNKMLMEAMVTHKILTTIFFEVHLKKNDNLAFSKTSNFGLDCGE
jgi:hypothetical protein